jgi:hypothetical protein
MTPHKFSNREDEPSETPAKRGTGRKPAGETHADRLLGLQFTAGNAAVSALLGPTVQRGRPRSAAAPPRPEPLVTTGKENEAFLRKSGVKWGYTEADEELLHDWEQRGNMEREPLVLKWAQAAKDKRAEVALVWWNKFEQMDGARRHRAFILSYDEVHSAFPDWFPDFKSAKRWAERSVDDALPKDGEGGWAKLRDRLRNEYLAAFQRWTIDTKEWREASLEEYRNRKIAKAKAEAARRQAAGVVPPATAGDDYGNLP